MLQKLKLNTENRKANKKKFLSYKYKLEKMAAQKRDPESKKNCFGYFNTELLWLI
jgi:hypothetical protein